MSEPTPTETLLPAILLPAGLLPPRPRTAAPLPVSQAGVTIRPAVIDDVPFMDSLQKLHTKQVGWMPRAQFEGKIRLGHVLIAEERREPGDVRREEDGNAFLTPHASALTPSSPVGYCIGNDQYFKHDDVGIIYQMNVLPGRQRGLVGAALLKAQFERSAYGCKLYCCWCAQDIAANQFWEAMGFVPLAFRTGGEKKGPNGQARCHIFWQKRIREGDTTTPWWFPSQTSGGSMRSDRIVLPIPPGTHWSDAKPMILPGTPMPSDVPALPAVESEDTIAAKASRPPRASKRVQRPAPVLTREPVTAISLKTRGLRFGPVGSKHVPTSAAPPSPVAPAAVAPAAVPSAVDAPAVAPRRAKKTTKNDPRLVVAARELRDRWLEQVNGNGPAATPLIGCEKYAVSRAIGADVTIEIAPTKLLAA